MSAVLAWPCLPYGGWLISKRCPLQRAFLRAEKHWPPTAEVQGCIQERHEGTQHQHQFLVGPRCQPHQLEKHTSQTAAVQQKEADSGGSREVSLPKRKWQPTDQSQCTDATYATEIVTLTLVSTATGGTAQAKQTAWTSNGWIIIIHGQP